MRTRMSRRSLLGMLPGALGAVVVANRMHAKEASSAACYWRYDRAECFGTTSYERWCYRCCGPTGCEDAYCEWRPMASC